MVSRSGPVVAVEPAGLNVWQPEHPALRKVASAGPAPAGALLAAAAFASCALTHAENALAVDTLATVRITPCPSPQGSVQTAGTVPRRLGVITGRVVIPGTTPR